MASQAQSVAMTIHLEVAESCIKRGDFRAAMLALQSTLKVANEANHKEIKRLVFKAMNVLRPAIRSSAQ